MNIARLNLAHGTLSEHARYVQAIRNLSKGLHTNVKILSQCDMKGEHSNE